MRSKSADSREAGEAYPSVPPDLLQPIRDLDSVVSRVDDIERITLSCC